MSRTDRTQTHFLTAFVLLWLTGTALRLTILAVPPVIPLIHAFAASPEPGRCAVTSILQTHKYIRALVRNR